MSEGVTSREAPGRAGLVLRNFLFTAVVPGLGGAYGPWLILRHRSASPTPIAWPAVAVIAIGLVLYFSCQWVFAAVGRGTPGLWDAPRRLVEVGPYRWARTPRLQVDSSSAGRRLIT